MKQSIRTKITTTFFIVLGLMIANTAWSYIQLSTNFESQIINQLVSTNQSRYEHIQTYLDELEERAYILGKNPLVIEAEVM